MTRIFGGGSPRKRGGGTSASRKKSPGSKASSRQVNNSHNGGNKSTANSHIAKRAPRNKQSVPARAGATRYRAVTIQGGMLCCKAAQRIANQKFLAAHAPTLPLGGCSQPKQCQCKYRHMSDRRQERRRDTDHGLPVRVYTENERRGRRDRRHAKPKDS